MARVSSHTQTLTKQQVVALQSYACVSMVGFLWIVVFFFFHSCSSSTVLAYLLVSYLLPFPFSQPVSSGITITHVYVHNSVNDINERTL